MFGNSIFRIIIQMNPMAEDVKTNIGSEYLNSILQLLCFNEIRSATELFI